MYLKSDKFSIKTRLAVLYGFTAFVLLTVIALFLHWETINILHKADYQFLSDEVDTIQYILHDKSPESAEFNDQIINSGINPDQSIYRYYARLFDDTQQVIIETPGMDAILPEDKSLTTKAVLINKKRYWWYSINDTNYLIIQSPILLDKGKQGSIQIALDISYQHGVVSDRKLLILSIIFATLCAALLGMFIARRGIRSLEELTQTAKNISITSLTQRIDPKSYPKELRELGEAFNQMLARIDASFTRLKQFSDDLAHELRIPINNLIGETEITLTRPHTISEYQQVLGSNIEELQRIAQIIENILFLARAENPQMEIEKQSLVVEKEIGIVCDFYQTLAEEKNITLSCAGNGSVSANSIMFRRMISNLLANALQHTPNGGWIKVAIQQFDTIHVKIIIQDNGPGIPAKHLPKLFDRFYRIDAARTTGAGTGLGLAIAKSIVDLHHGTINVTSEIDKGTTFTIIL